MRTPILFLIALLLLVLSLTPTTRAANLNLTGNVTGSSTLTPTGTPGDFIQNFSGTGIDTGLGAFDITSQSTVDFGAPPAITITNGSLTETFPGGTLFGASFGTGTASGTGTAAITLHFDITGGTGLFSGDTGEATIIGTLTTTSPTTEDFTGNFNGSVATTPLPASGLQAAALITLLAAGLALKRASA